MDAVTVDRFMSKFAVNEDGGCWEWQAYKDKDGYGNFRAKGKVRKSHRISFELFIGPIEKGLYVLHSCDNPKCVNPQHLFQGTQYDNMEDMRNKNRNRAGSTMPAAKLDEKKVFLIRKFLEINGKGRAAFLSRWFGVGDDIISRIKTGKIWRHVDGYLA